mgnify:CR=1 FL=1
MSDDSAIAAPQVPKASRFTAGLVGLPLRVAIIATLVLLVAAFGSLVWTPHAVQQPNLTQQLIAPGGSYLLGTDAQGRDVLSLILKGMLTSYVVAAVGSAVGLFIGVPLGLFAAWRGGLADRLVGWAGGYLATLPALAIAALMATLSGPGAAAAMLAIGVASIPIFARASRNAGTRLLRSDYFAAARLAGMSLWEAASHHVVPELRGVLLERAAVAMGAAVVAEAALSFAGLAAQPGAMSLGLMLREAQSYLMFNPNLVLAPGIAIGLMAGLLHLIGDRLAAGRDSQALALEDDDGAA